MASACLPSIKWMVDVAENHFATLIRQCYSESTFPCVSRDFLSCSTTSRKGKEDTKPERSVDTHTDKDWEGTGEGAQACSFWRSRTTKTAAVASRKLLPSVCYHSPLGPTYITLKLFFCLFVYFLFGKLICWPEKLCAVFSSTFSWFGLQASTVSPLLGLL